MEWSHLLLNNIDAVTPSLVYTPDFTSGRVLFPLFPPPFSVLD